MKLFNFLKFDFVYGIFKSSTYKKLLILIALFSLASLEFHSRLVSVEYSEYSIGDYFLYVFGGMQEYIPDPSNPFQIPYLWLIFHIVVLFFTLHYMHDDLTGFGQQTIYRSGSRVFWWVSKCLWNIGIVGIFYLFAWLTILVFSIIYGAKPSFDISPFMSQLMNFGGKQIITDHWELTIELTILPLLVTLALSMMQMTLCLILKPIFSYIITSVVLISSAYYLSPALIGNYAMALRSNKVVTNGWSLAAGIGCSLFLVCASVLVGLCIFRRCNIINKDIN